MIAVRLDVFFMLMVFIPLFVLTALVIYYSILSRHRSSHSHEAIYSCAHCGHVYAIARHRPMDHCPRCGTLNEAVRT
jgi:rRNA maturation endonuclease Nob1